jgi:hypothetical protein
VPGGTVVVNRDSGRNHVHDDLQVAIRDAFETAERKIRAVKASHATRGRATQRTGAAPTQG